MAGLTAELTARVRTRLHVEAAREQAAVGAGQVAAGIGNLGFSLVMARFLAPGSFAQLASFLALYTVLGMPSTSLSAVAALGPHHAPRLRAITRWGGLGAGVLIAAVAPWLSGALRLPVAMVVILGLSAPVVWSVALDRGHLYGHQGYRSLVASLVAEPAVRLTVGIALAVALGAVGGAAGVAVAGFAALELARRGRFRAWLRNRRPAPGTGQTLAGAATLGWTAVAFLLLVVVQNQDLLIANRRLAPVEAGQFAVLSTIGGLAAFATLTIPLVLLPRAAGGERRALAPALGAAGLLGGGALALVAVAPGPLVGSLFGQRYGSVANLVVPYVLAMALLGVARVLAAHRCAIGASRSTAVLVAMAAAAQAAVIVSFGHSPRSVAFATLGTTAGLSGALGSAAALELAPARRVAEALRRVVLSRASLVVSGATAVGLLLRFAIPRGLWLDEVTSVFQARMGYHAMLQNLRATDVHPPLYFTVLWATIRWLGSSGELAVRVPSIVFGALVVPMLYALGKEAYDERTGMIAAVLGSVAPLMIWYSQEARMYSLLMLLGVVVLWAQVRAVKRGGALPWVVYALASAGLAWTQYFGLFQVLAQQLVFLGIIWKRRRDAEPMRGLVLGWGLSLAAFLVVCLPLVPFAYHQFVVNQTAGRGFGGPSNVGNAVALSGNHVGVYSVVANLIWAMWGYHSNRTITLIGALWPLGMLLVLVSLGRRRQWVTTLFGLAAVVPLLGMFALGTVKPQLFDVRYLSTIVPAIFILLARGVSGLVNSQRLLRLALAALVVLMLGSLADQQLNASNPRMYDFRGALHLVDRQARPGDVVVYDPVSISNVVTYYAPGVPKQLITSDAPAMLRRTRSAPEVFVLASPPLEGTTANANALATTIAVLDEHRHLVSRRTLSNVTLWVYR